MQLKAKLHRITNLNTFAASYLATGGKPTTGFTSFGKARVHLATDFPTGAFSGSFIPSMSLKTDADSQGAFSFQVADGLAKSRGQIVAFRTTTIPNPLPSMPPITVLDPIYRSAPFKFSDVSTAEQSQTQNLFVHLAETPIDQGISQGELDGQLKTLRKELGLDKLTATIKSNRVAVTAEKSGGTMTFSAHVRGSTSDDLGRVIEVKAGEIDIDLPGPDFIVGLCVNEDEIEAQIRKGLSGLSKKVSTDLLAELNKQVPGLTSLATISVWRTRFEQSGTKTIKLPVINQTIEVPVMSVVPDAAVGVPKKLY